MAGPVRAKREDGKPVNNDRSRGDGGVSPNGNDPNGGGEPQNGFGQQGGPEQQGPGQQGFGDQGSPGQIRYQDPDSTAAREPTLAEKRARVAAEKRQQEQQAAELAAAEHKSRKRRRAMIGAGATVGVVALVAASYGGSEYANAKNEVQQFCAAGDQAQGAQQGERVADENCDPQYVQNHGGHVSGGMIFMPMFIGGPPVPQYRYGYSQPGQPAPKVGQTAPAGSFTKPSGNTIKDTKGSTVQRGGFGVSNKSGSTGS